MQVTPGRVAEFERLIADVQAWASQEQDVSAVGLAGSWAKGVARMDSDADLVVVCADPNRFEHDAGWIRDALGVDAQVVRTQLWGVLLERRVQLSSGFEVEFGFVTPSWADVEPVDAGTARVVKDGFRVLHDPSGLLHRLTTTLRP
jgi:predicted nucleotidyltransferase